MRTHPAADAVNRHGFIADGRRELNRLYGGRVPELITAVLWPMPEQDEVGVKVTLHLLDKPNLHFYERLNGFPSETLKAKIMLLAP